MEQVVYDRQSGQLLTASFMDYAMPRADDFCDFEVESNPVPTEAFNPLGAKGSAGEAGHVGALPAVMNAIIDALALLGVLDLEMPTTPERVWAAISRPLISADCSPRRISDAPRTGDRPTVTGVPSARSGLGEPDAVADPHLARGRSGRARTPQRARRPSSRRAD